MTKERKIEILKDLLIQLSDSANILCTCEADERCEVVEECIKALEQQPSDETVKYLECDDTDLKRFAEVMKHQRLQVIPATPTTKDCLVVDDCVSRQSMLDAITEIDDNINMDIYTNEVREIINELPPVTPTQCIAAVRFSKDDLKEICNERIEIECTHGMCKDCTKSKILNNFEGYSIVCSRFGRMAVNPDFYCADFEKRGSEDD